jgi:ribonuclease I
MLIGACNCESCNAYYEMQKRLYENEKKNEAIRLSLQKKKKLSARKKKHDNT